jgi:hypothetical protein
LPFSAALEGYISFHSSIRNAAIATSCPPQSEISVGCPLDGRGTIGVFRSRFRGDVAAANVEVLVVVAKDTGEREVGRGGSCGKLGSVLNLWYVTACSGVQTKEAMTHGAMTHSERR